MSGFRHYPTPLIAQSYVGTGTNLQWVTQLNYTFPSVSRPQTKMNDVNTEIHIQFTTIQHTSDSGVLNDTNLSLGITLPQGT